jgi:hypothetical protein
MRKLSYVCATLALASPIAAFWYVRHLSAAYEAANGFPAEGKGFAGIFILGMRGLLWFGVLALTCAAVAHRRLGRPRPLVRHIELACFIAPLVAAISLAVMWLPSVPVVVYVFTGLTVFLKQP